MILMRDRVSFKILRGLGVQNQQKS